MQAKDVMTTPVVTVGPETLIADIAKRLLERRISAVPVVEDDGRLVGIVSEGDLMRRPEAGGKRHRSWWLALLVEPEAQARAYVKSHGARAREVMTRGVVSVGEGTSLEEIAALLQKYRIKRVPVLREGKLVGIVSRANLLHGVVARGRKLQPSADDRALRERVADALNASDARSEFINVVVAGGVVHLWGAAYSEAERDALRTAAGNVEGVRDIAGEIGVFPPMVGNLLWAE